jgi:hypothetical protein
MGHYQESTMSRNNQDSIFTRIGYGITAAIVAGLGAVVLEATDFLFWKTGWVEAESLSEYLHKVWFIPVGLAAVAFVYGIFKGSRAIDGAMSLWSD